MKFVYLIRSRNNLRDNYRFLKNNDSDVIISTWKEDHVKEEWFELFYHTNTTWGDGRNELLKIAYSRAIYDYYIFLDDDIGCDFEKNVTVLQDFISSKKPYILHPLLSFKSCNEGQQYQLKYNCDASFCAYRKDVIEDIFPYYNKLQDKSWHYSQAIINILQTIMHNKNRIQFNDILYKNLLNDSYNNRNNDWDYFIEFMKTIVLDKFHNNIECPTTEDINLTKEMPNENFDIINKINIDDFLKKDTDFYKDKFEFWKQLKNN